MYLNLCKTIPSQDELAGAERATTPKFQETANRLGTNEIGQEGNGDAGGRPGGASRARGPPGREGKREKGLPFRDEAVTLVRRGGSRGRSRARSKGRNRRER